MRNYSILVDSSKDVKAVKVGFCWPAFFLPGLWALLKVQIDYFLIAFGVNIVILLLPRQSPVLQLICSAGLMIWFGFTGNEAVVKRLVKAGYELKDPIEATNAQEAVARYREKQDLASRTHSPEGTDFTVFTEGDRIEVRLNSIWMRGTAILENGESAFLADDGTKTLLETVDVEDIRPIRHA